jgi:hypothetical protein
MKNCSSKKFHFMIAAQVVFAVQAEGSEPALNTAFINGVVTNDKDVFPSRLVGKAQQIAQMQLFKRLGDEAKNVNVLDVVIMSIMNLGYMTDGDFLAAPEGTAKKEKAGGAKLSVVGSAANDLLDPVAIAAGTTH